ncbi:MAG TPA: hypothetical protein VGO93_04485 [Candidatus Xenobia bacterium]|jgi:hypothetical protein
MKRGELAGTLFLAFALGALFAAAEKHAGAVLSWTETMLVVRADGPLVCVSLCFGVWMASLLLAVAAKTRGWKWPIVLFFGVSKWLPRLVGLMVMLGLSCVVSLRLGATGWAQGLSNAADVVAVFVLLGVPILLAAWQVKP